MFVYFKKTEGFEELITHTASMRFIAGKLLKDYEGCPYIDMFDDPDILLYDNEKLKKFFFKATILAFPHYRQQRTCGIYILGKAAAILLPAANAPYWLQVETKDWEGVRDLALLQEKLWAGTIVPVVSYEREQAKFNLLADLTLLVKSMADFVRSAVEKWQKKVSEL